MKISAPPMLRMCLAASLAALCAATVPNAQAATRTLRTDLSYPWINDGTASNWVEGVFPTAADDIVLNGSGQWGGFFSPTYQSIAFYGMAACYTGGTVTATLDMDMYSGTTCGWGAQNHNLSIGRNLVVGKSATGANLNGFAAINVAGNATFGGVAGSIGYLRLTNGDATIGGTLTLAAVAGSVGDLGLQGRKLQAPRLVMGVPGSASWLRLGGGTLTLTTGASNFDGAFSESGTVSLTGGATLGLGANTSFGGTAGTIGFSTPGAVSVAGLRFDSPGFVVNGSAFNLPNASTTLASSAGVTAATLNNVLSGSGTVTKAGTGALTLNAVNTLTGPIAVSAGTLVAGNASALGTTANGTSVGSGGTLALPGGITIASEPLSIAGPGVAAGVGALSNIAGLNTFAGPITLAAAASIGSTAGTLTLPNTIALGANTLTFDGAGSTTVNGVVSGAGGLAKAGAGTATVNAAATYGGTTTVSAGSLQLGVNGALPPTTATSVAVGAMLDLNGKTQTFASLSSNGTLALGSGGSLTLGAGAHSIGAITGSGTITVNSGATLALTSALANGAVNFVLAGGTLNPGALTHSIGTLSVSAASTLDFAGAANAQLTVATLTPGAALAVTNWTAGADHFYASAIAGTPTQDLVNITPLTNIKLGSNAATATYWSSSGNELLAAAAFNYWDGPAVNRTSLEGGTGTWNAGTANWTTSNGTPNGVWTLGAVANFDGAGGTVTVAGTQDIGGLNFNAGTSWAINGPGVLQGTATNNLLTSASGLSPYIAAVLSGSNSWEKRGAGGYTLAAGNTFSGPFLITAGYVAIVSNNALGTTVGATTVSNGAALYFYNNITIPEPLGLDGGSLVSQRDSNTYSGPIALTADSSIQVLANTLTLTGSVSGAKDLTLQADGTLNANGVLGTGTGGINKKGTGTAVFNVVNTYTGATTVNAGRLVLGISNAVNAASNTAVASGATLDLNSKTLSLARLTSAGTLALGTAGSLTLSSGASSIGAVTGSGTITLNSGATLTLTSALVNSGVNIVLAGGMLNPGAFTHSIGTLTVSAASTLDFAGAANAQLTVATLTPSAALAVTNWAAGADHFYASAITGSPAKNQPNVAPLNSITLGGNAASATYWSSTGNELLAFTGPTTYWDGPGANATTVEGGSGTWDASTSNWTTSNGSPNSLWAGGSNVATFGAPGGTVTVSGTQSIGGLNFTTGGYTLTGGTLSGAAATTTLTAGAGVGATIASVLAGANGFEKTGAGTMTLTGNNTFTGALTVTTGSLTFASANAGGSTSAGTTVGSGAVLAVDAALTYAEPLTLAGGTLNFYYTTGGGMFSGATQLTASSTISAQGGFQPTTYFPGIGAVAIGANNLQICSSSILQLEFRGVISGTGAITSSCGTAQLKGNNTYTGLTTVDGGTLTVNAANGLGTTSAGTVVTAGARLQINGVGLDVSAEPLALAGTLSHHSAFNTMRFGGPITLTGNATIASSQNFEVYSTIANSGNVLSLDSSNTSTGLLVSGPIAGTGGITSSGVGLTKLSGTNTYAGPTNVTAGVLVIGNGGSSGNLTATSEITVATNAILRLRRSDAFTFDRIVSGAGTVEQAGSGTATLAGANMYTGATTVSSGTLLATHASALGTTANGTTVSGGASLGLGGVAIGAEALTISGAGVSGAGALYGASGVNGYGGAITLAADATIANASTGALTLSGAIGNAGFTSTFGGTGSIAVNGVVSGAGGLVKAGAGMTTLNSAALYGGTTTVGAGTLQLGANGVMPSVSATTVAAGATLDLNGKTQSLSSMTSSGTLALGTGGSLTLTAGTHSIGAVTGSGTNTVGSGAVLTLTSALVNSGVNLVLAGGTLNLGVLTHTIGTLTVNAASTLDFATGTAQLAVDNLSMAAGGSQTLTVTNWTRGSDQFTATNINATSTLARNSAGQAPLSRVALGGASPGITVWTASGASPANEITTGIATVKIQKTTVGGFGGPFGFSRTNLASTPANISTTSAGTATPASPAAIAVTTLGTAVTITETSVDPYVLTGVVCTDANGAATGNTGTFATRSGNVLTIPAVNVKAGADITCVFTNQYITLNYWDGANTTAGGSTTGGDGGTATWNGTTTNWTSSTGAPNGVWDSDSVAIFGGAPGVVSVTGTQSIGGLSILTNGYTFDGSGTLAGSPSAVTTLYGAAGTDMRNYTVVMSGGAYAKTGDGTIRLDTNNTFSGPVSITGGTLVIGHANAMGVTGSTATVESGAALTIYNGITLGRSVTLNGGTFIGSSAFTTLMNGAISLTDSSKVSCAAAGNCTIAAPATIDLGATGNQLTLEVTGTGVLSINRVIRGTGPVVKTGTGRAVLGASNTYIGATTASVGTLTLGVSNAIPSTSATTIADGATLNLNNLAQTLSNGLTATGTLALGTGGSLTLSGGSSTLAGANLTGSGTITVGSGAVLTLTSALVNSGVNLVLAGGTLNLGVLTHSIGTLSLTANSTLDFSSAGNAGITAATLALGTRALNVTNWTRGGDRFYATAFTGASANVVGSAPVNQITLSGPVSYTPAMTVWQSDREINVLLDPVLRIAETSTGGVGTFEFTMAGLSANRDAITTTTAGVAAPGIANLTGTAGTPVTITESSVPAGWPASPSSASCVDANGASNGNGSGSFGVLADRVLTVPAARMVAGANITCTFVNSLRGFGGVVFNDGGAPSGGANTGVPNDGLRNGAEAGLPGIAVTLTDCGTVVHSSTVTDGGGAWNLDVPGSVAAGSTVCVAAAVPAKSLATGANAGGTVVPDGTTATAGGVAYTYSRPLHRFSFAAPAGGTATMNFGEVPQSSFGAAGVRQSAANTPVVYAHNFVAGTGGTLVLSIAGEATNPASPGSPWSGLVYADTGCTGTLQPGAAQLYPGSATTAVVQGQTVCLIVREQVPANADSGTINQTTVKALLTFAAATPALSATYTLVDSTTVGGGALTLAKEVRNLTTNGAWSANNQARSGQVLEYRVTYTNVTATPVTKVVVDDTVPAYTSFQSAGAGTIPAALGNCTMNTPQNPVPAAAVGCSATQPAGGTGPLKWTFDGSLNPGATGELRFQVRVD